MTSTELYKKPPQKYNFKKHHQFNPSTFLRIARKGSTSKEVGITFLQGGEIEICLSSQASTGCSLHICFFPPLNRFYIMNPTHLKPEIITIQTTSSFLKSVVFRYKLTRGIQLLNAKLLAIAPPISIPSSLTW